MDNGELLGQIVELIENQTMQINLKIENEVTKRIDALFDGYKLAHEKLETLEKRIENLEIRAS